MDDLTDRQSNTVVVPGGCTSVLQPLDVSPNKPFKAYIRSKWLSFMERSVIEAKEAEAELSDNPFQSSNEENENANIPYQNLSQICYVFAAYNLWLVL